MTTWTAERWEQEGRAALVDLFSENVAVPWAEAVARISSGSWKTFRSVQPLQLKVALDHLMADGVVVRESTKHVQPVITYRLAETGLSSDALERIRGRRRALYRRFVSWTGDPAACGHHAEKVVLASLLRAAGRGGYFVPKQRVGHVPKLLDEEISPGPLDGLAVLHDQASWGTPIPMLLEVKNVHEWIYPWDRRLWELLVKAALVACRGMKVFPVLVCPHSAFTTYRMGVDIGFSRARYEIQLFTANEEKVPAKEFDQVVTEFGFLAARFPPDQPLPRLVEFFETEPRRDVHTVGVEGHRGWYEIAADRFHVLAPVIARFEGLAADVEQPQRSRMLRAFAAAARSTATWPWGGGW